MEDCEAAGGGEEAATVCDADEAAATGSARAEAEDGDGSAEAFGEAGKEAIAEAMRNRRMEPGDDVADDDEEEEDVSDEEEEEEEEVGESRPCPW